MSAAPDLHAGGHWAAAGAFAVAAHGALIGLAMTMVAHSPQALVPEPVVMVELPPQAAPAHDMAPPTRQEPVLARTAPPRFAVPPAVPPIPQDIAPLLPPGTATLSAQANHVALAAQPAAPMSAVSSMGAGTGISATAGNDPKAVQQEADYFSLVSAHLNRRKTYPAEARKARAQGVVTVRFTVDRNGGVTAVAIKRGSGHPVLDQATLDLVQRVAPLPRFPKSMTKDSVTLALPIDYSLRTI